MKKSNQKISKDSKVAIVTGGAKGIGYAIAEKLASQNFIVVIADLHTFDKKNSEHENQNLHFIKTDVHSESSVKNLVKTCISLFGKITVLINNAGVLPDDLPKIEETPLKLWNKFIETNLTGCFLCSKYSIPHIRKTKGSVVNIASTRFMQSEGNDAPYAASKGGIVSFTSAMAIELGPDIRVNAISPGWIHTEKKPLSKKDHQQHPVGRVGEPNDIANLAAFLVSEEASNITGQNYIIDGGMTSKMIYL